jgi:glycosyltransferase involved in cell wall biosynthesis
LLNPRDTIGKRLFFNANQALAWGCDSSHWHVSDQVMSDITGAMATRRNAVLLNACDMDTRGDAVTAQKLLDDAGCGAAYTVLLPGRLHPVKGHALLIEAAGRLVAAEGLSHSGFRLIFAGEGPERARIAAAAEAAGLTGHTVFLGAIAHQALLALYGRVDLVVTPSLAEGFSLVAVEALARGALLIASDAQGLATIVRPWENALQFPAGDADALYRCLRAAWERRGEEIIDRQAARAEMRRRFGLEDHLDRMLELLGLRSDGAATQEAG